MLNHLSIVTFWNFELLSCPSPSSGRKMFWTLSSFANFSMLPPTWWRFSKFMNFREASCPVRIGAELDNKFQLFWFLSLPPLQTPSHKVLNFGFSDFPNFQVPRVTPSPSQCRWSHSVVLFGDIFACSNIFQVRFFFVLVSLLGESQLFLVQNNFPQILPKFAFSLRFLRYKPPPPSNQKSPHFCPQTPVFSINFAWFLDCLWLCSFLRVASHSSEVVRERNEYLVFSRKSSVFQTISAFEQKCHSGTNMSQHWQLFFWNRIRMVLKCNLERTFRRKRNNQILRKSPFYDEKK